MKRPILIEGEVPPDHPAFTEAGCTYVPTVGCYGAPVRPEMCAAVNLSWFGNRICRSEWFGSDDGVPLVTPGEWVDGIRNGLLDYDAEAENIAPLAGLRPAHILVPNEAGLDPWSSSPRIWDCILSICGDSACKLKAPVAIRDLWAPSILADFAGGWQADPLYNQHQAGWKAWIATLKARAFRACLLAAGVITEEALIITNFIAAPRRPVKMPGDQWSIGKSTLPPQVCSNWQLYGAGWPDTQRCIDLSDSTRWFPTFNALTEPLDLAGRLLNAKHGCVIYMNDNTGDALTRHLPLLRAYTQGR